MNRGNTVHYSGRTLSGRFIHRTFRIVEVLCVNLHGRDLPCLTGVVQQKVPPPGPGK